MNRHAAGRFDVTLSPEPPFDVNEGTSLGRLAIKKQFRGDLEASSAGEMIAARTAVQGSAGYVAVERVVGSLGGLAGSFVLQHTGTMTRGKPSLSVTVVPDSGTAALCGLSGTMVIEIVDGAHFYKFDYALDAESSNTRST